MVLSQITYGQGLSVLLSVALVLAQTPGSALRALSDAIPSAPEHRTAPVPPKPSRALSLEEMGGLRGRSLTAGNPYTAGQQKWAVVYNGVDLTTGNFSTSATDLSFEGGYGVPANVTRSYSANNADDGPLGKGWTLSVDLRSTAGGVLKSESAPVRSVPVLFQERNRPKDEFDEPILDPRRENEPVDAVTAVDAAGFEHTIQRDVDGVLMSPLWDSNEHQTRYETVYNSGKVYTIPVEITTTTPEGTVYLYEKRGYFLNPSEGVPSNLLKVTKVTDRQGNETVYTYGSNFLEFDRNNGSVEENPLLRVDMPGGRSIILRWGFQSPTDNPLGTVPGDRLHSVMDDIGGNARVVYYGYGTGDDAGRLTVVRSPGGKDTLYGWGEAAGFSANRFLTGIIDMRGMKTTIAYAVEPVWVLPYFVQMDAVVAYRVDLPNRVSTHYQYYHNDWRFTETVDTRMGTPTTLQTWLAPNGVENAGFCHFADVAWNPDTLTWVVTNAASLRARYEEGAFRLVMCDPWVINPAGMSEMDPLWVWKRYYGRDTLALAREESRVFSTFVVDTRSLRGFSDTHPILSVAKDTVHNFQGNPLQEEVTEWENNAWVRTRETHYAYWGKDKYYQRKAVIALDNEAPIANRVSFTDYYPDTASAGRKGQTKEVYDEKHADFGPDFGAGTPKQWRDGVAPSSGLASAKFDYDSVGRVVKVEKLFSTTGPVYVRTDTEYSSGSGYWGMAYRVIEDVGGLNRTTTTNLYDYSGRVIETTDPTGRKYETTYLDKDGRVSQVRRVLPTTQNIVTYTYGSNGTASGMVSQVWDKLSNYIQSFTYRTVDGTGTGIAAGEIATVVQEKSMVLGSSFSNTYDYWFTGDRKSTVHSGPNGTTRWGYFHNARMGFPESPKQLCQTLSLLDESMNRTAEEFHYQYDGAGRVLHVAFAQAPKTAGYDDIQNGGFLRRAHTFNRFLSDGQLITTETIWEEPGAEQYNNLKIRKQFYTYDAFTGLRTQAAFQEKTASGNYWTTYRTDQYAYDELGQLVSENWGGSVSTWSYDPAGNRYGSGLSGHTYDRLNRLAASPGASYLNDKATPTSQDQMIGNRTWKNHGQSSVRRYQWDELNRLLSACGSAKGARYEYRADGMRTLKVEGLTVNWLFDEESGSGWYDDIWTTNKPTVRYFYDGQMLVEEDSKRLDPVQGPITSVTRYGLGARGVEMIWWRPEGEAQWLETNKRFPLYDGHGNMTALLTRGTTGFTLSDSREFDAWGRVRFRARTGYPTHRYCASLGHVQDDESGYGTDNATDQGLVYMRARYYDPESGRFVSEDPARDGVNWFTYCGNDPVSKVDPTGYWVEIGGMWFSFDKNYSQEGTGRQIQDLTWGFKRGQRFGSLRPDGTVKHGRPMTAAEISRIKKALGGRLSGRGQGFLRKLAKNGGYGVLSGGFVFTSLDASFMADPSGFDQLIQEVGGEWPLFEGGVTVGAD